MPRLTADQLREPLIEGAFETARNQSHPTVSRKSLFTDPTHRRVFRQMLADIVADPETDEVGRAAGKLLTELGAGGDADA